MKKKFTFLLPITTAFPDVHRREGIAYEHIGNWKVSGIAYKKIKLLTKAEQSYEYEIEEIVFSGTTINPSFETPEMFEGVKAACNNHIAYIFDDDRLEVEFPAVYKIGKSATVIELLHRREAL